MQRTHERPPGAIPRGRNFRRHNLRFKRQRIRPRKKSDEPSKTLPLYSIPAKMCHNVSIFGRWSALFDANIAHVRCRLLTVASTRRADTSSRWRRGHRIVCAPNVFSAEDTCILTVRKAYKSEWCSIANVQLGCRSPTCIRMMSLPVKNPIRISPAKCADCIARETDPALANRY